LVDQPLCADSQQLRQRIANRVSTCQLNNVIRNYSAALYLRLLNSHLIGFLALAKERVRLLPFGWHPGTQLLGAYLNSYRYSLLIGAYL
ncbi:MAG: hypothetical protein KZQ60_12605, partial [Candidatus Thiodiazotropha sp. (ex Lucinoma aequizonata)]|nr:hypothetical protein [Candidatus Thiodiazotropha sp. (ex Lucinoma aequizonata)]MCU7907981.1 hypothetical protein [Candidatus Thiodiazotropha sp. (ex Lucinoma aequizonata)]